MLFVIISLIFTLATRLLYLKSFPLRALERDATGHLLYVNEIRKNGYRIPKKIERFIFDVNDYPNGFHKIIALTRIPQTFLEENGGLLPILFDSLLLLLTAGIIAVAGGGHYEWLLLFPLLRMFWGYEDRAFHFSERAFGVLWGNVYLACTLMFVTTHQWPWLLGALAGFLVLSCSSKFTWQAVTFFTALLSLLLPDWQYLAVFGGVLAVSALITRGYNIEVLLGLIRHSYCYKTHDMKVNWGLNPFYRDWITLFHRLRGSRLVYLFFQNPLGKLVSNFPVILPFFAVWQSFGFAMDPWVACALAGMILVPIIATESLKFLGEPERYLEYSVLPVMVVLSRVPVQEHLPSFIAAVLLGLWAVHFQINLKLRDSDTEVDAHEQYMALERFVAELPPGRILTIPNRVSFRLGYQIVRHEYVTVLSNISGGEIYETYRQLFPDYCGYPGRNLQGYIDRYGVDYLVASKKYLDILERKMKAGDYYNLSGFKILYDSSHFTVYRAQRTATASEPETAEARCHEQVG